MHKQKNPLGSSHLLIYVTVGIAAPIAVFYLMILTTDPFSGAFGGPQTQTSIQHFFMYVLLGVMFASPVLAPLLAYRYFKQRDRQYTTNQKTVTKREEIEFKRARDTSRKNQLIILGLIIVGVLFILNAKNISSAATDYWVSAKESLRYSAATKKGCRELNAYNIVNSSQLAKGHFEIVSNFGYETYEKPLHDYAAKINNSFDDCADGKITAVDQTKLVSDYLKFLEDTSHKLLATNPLNLSEAEITNIRTLEAKNHQ